MFDATIIQQIKQSNVSVDGEKTQQRVKELWKKAKSPQKNEICRLADIAVSTIYRVYRIGSISVKLALAIGQTLDVNPLYLIGQEDEGCPFNEDQAKELLAKHGYQKVLAEYEKLQKRLEREAQKEEKLRLQQQEKEIANQEFETFDTDAGTTLNDAAETYEQEQETVSESEDSPATSLTDDEILALLRSLRIRAGLGVQSATDALKKLGDILLA